VLLSDSAADNWMSGAESFFTSHGVPIDMVRVPEGTRGALPITVRAMTYRSTVGWRRIFATRVTGMDISIKAGVSTFAHEMGHVFGLDERYVGLPSGFSQPDPSYRGNLMADHGPSLTSGQLSIVKANLSDGWSLRLKVVEGR